METIPPKHRHEWADLLIGPKELKLSNFILQMKVTNARKKIKEGSLSLSQAIDEIYDLCEKYQKAIGMADDIRQIFNQPVSPKNRTLTF